MEMSEERSIPASRDEVWQALNDPDVLQEAMPGCDQFEATGDNEYIARITAKVGPVKARFKFRILLQDIEPPTGYTLNGEGQGGAAGFAKGSARVELEESAEGTILRYTVKANVGGKLAQLGARLIDGTARKMADAFFGNFIEIVSADSDGVESEDAGQVSPKGAKD